MGEFRLPLRKDYPKDGANKWGECCLCGPARVSALLHYDNAAADPVVGEKITGDESGHSGVVSIVYSRGADSGGLYGGVVVFESISGYEDPQLTIFKCGETLTGATSGSAFARAKSDGAVQKFARLVNEDDLITFHGKKYCRAHFKFKFSHDWIDDQKVETKEGDRE